MSRQQPAPKKVRRKVSPGRSRRELGEALQTAEAHNAALMGALEEILPLLTGEAAGYSEALRQMLQRDFAGSHLIRALRRAQDDAKRNSDHAEAWERQVFLANRDRAALIARLRTTEQQAAALGVFENALLGEIEARNAALTGYLADHDAIAEVHGGACGCARCDGSGRCRCETCQAARPLADAIPAPIGATLVAA